VNKESTRAVEVSQEAKEVVRKARVKTTRKN
jgi:hypothetical protein